MTENSIPPPVYDLNKTRGKLLSPGAKALQQAASRCESVFTKELRISSWPET